MDNQNEKYLAKTLFGLEDVLFEELEQLGLNPTEKVNRGVWFETDQLGMYRANLCVRTALRIMKPLKSFRANSPESLYNSAKKINWKHVISLDKTFAIQAVVNSESFKHSQYAALKLKDAIVDHFQAKFGKRPNIDKHNPDVFLNLHISHEQVNISIDSSGQPLNKRGYRPGQARAPLNEVLAAGILAISGFDGSKDFLDPMCGSGTFLFEAVNKAANIPAQWNRKHYAFMNWDDFDEEMWMKLREEVWENKKVPTCTFTVGDKSRGDVLLLEKIAKRLPIKCDVNIEHQDFFLSEGREGFCVFINPPYDIRLGEKNIELFYEKMGNTLKNQFQGSEAWIISGNLPALKRIGLKATSKTKLFNGPTECRLQHYDLYEGSRKGVSESSTSDAQ